MITVDIWSDVRCPFCYIGKRNFENALDRFKNKEQVQVTWHSFELDPSLETQPDMSIVDYFVQTKGVSAEQARQMLNRAKEMAEGVGLTMDNEKAILANSFKAHQLLQLAKNKGVADETKEALFRAHFAEGRNIDDVNILIEIGKEAGLQEEDSRKALSSDQFADAVKQDQIQAQQIGVQGVPFFVFNNKYGVSGAQPTDTFLDVLQKLEKES